MCSSGLFLKADAKVRLFSELPKLFQENFQFLAKKIRDLTNIKPRNGVTPYYIYKGLLVYTNKGLLAFLRSLTDEVHELIELRSDDNLRTAVALLTDLRIVRGDGVVLTTSASRQALRVNTVVVLQGLNH